MRTKVFAALVVCGFLLSPVSVNAQTGIAFATWGAGNVFDGFVGPFKVTETGIEMAFVALCFAPSTRAKATPEIIAVIPDGTTLSDLRVIITTAVINGCAQYKIAVPRALVFLPVLQNGQ